MSQSKTSNTIAVRVSNLVKHYQNGTQANRDINFTASSGEAIAILGPNGAGKTTFLRQITTELKPTGGTIEIFGIDAIANPVAAKQLMGITPQEAGVFETLSVRQHLELFGKLKGLKKVEARMQTGELLDALELTEQANKPVGALSGGQRRRILIGLALLGRPPLLILDEPTTGLDPASRRSVWKLLQKVIKTGTTVIFSTHYLEEAEHLSQRISFINAGKIIADGSLSELRARFPQRYKISFLAGDANFTHLNAPSVEYFDSFSEAQDYVAEQNVSEYQISAASLEDVYFSLVGEHLNGNGDGGNALKK